MNLATLGLPTPPPAPKLKPSRAESLDLRQARRLLLNQILAAQLQSNTYRLATEHDWPNREHKLTIGLAVRIGELYDRYYERNNTSEVDWLNNVINLSEGATISILALAVEGNPIKTARLGELLTQLAQLAGTYQQD